MIPFQGRVPEVGLEVAGVLQVLRDAAGLRLEMLHLVGHSLGAHVSGFAAKYFNGSIARITGVAATTSEIKLATLK